MNFFQVRQFHSAGALLVRARYLKKLNRLHKHWAKELFKPQAEFVDPVLGRSQVPWLDRVRATLGQANNFVGPLTSEETSKLIYGAEQAAKSRTEFAQDVDVADVEARKREIYSRITSLDNSNQQQLKRRALQMAVDEFGRAAGDTGSSEVQAAAATIRIHYMAAHAKEHKQDLQTKKLLEHLVQIRRNMLLYLKKKDPQRYLWTIEKLGLSDEAVSAEFHMSRKYLSKTQFYGENTLPDRQTRRDAAAATRLARKKAKALKYLAHNNPDMVF